MPTSASNSGRGQKISLPTCLPSNRRSWRHEEAHHRLKHNSRVGKKSIAEELHNVVVLIYLPHLCSRGNFCVCKGMDGNPMCLGQRNKTVEKGDMSQFYVGWS